MTASVGQTKQTDVPFGLDAHEPEKVWGIWQKPESRFTHFGVGPPGIGSSWMLICSSEAVAHIYIAFDAADNGRTGMDYEARKLSLPEAFDEARNQPLPITYSTGDVYGIIGGIAIFDVSGTQFCITDLLPL